jgi:hypothetical protein
VESLTGPNNYTLLSHLRLCSLFVTSYDAQGLRWKYSNPPVVFRQILVSFSGPNREHRTILRNLRYTIASVYEGSFCYSDDEVLVYILWIFLHNRSFFLIARLNYNNLISYNYTYT